MINPNQEQIEKLERQLQAAKRMAAAKRAHDHLLDFIHFTMPHPENPEDVSLSLYEEAIHHRALCELLEKVERGEQLRVIITMPPRHGKSEIASRRFPAWFIGRQRTRQIIFTTYSDDFAQDFGKKNREIIDSSEYRQVFKNVCLKKGSKAADKMDIENGGMLKFTGIGGGITGRGADLLIIDDPIKDKEEADSITMRNKIWEWYTTTAFTRLMPGGAVVIIMTRWHEDDLVGRLTDPTSVYYNEEEAKKWFIFNLPAIKDENTPKEKALWPKRYSLEHLKSVRNVLGPRDWNALFQQRPSPPEGSFFKNADIFTYRMNELPKKLTMYSSVDFAVSMVRGRNKTCNGYIGIDENDVLWLLPDLVWEQIASDEATEKIVDKLILYNVKTLVGEKGQISNAIGPFFRKVMRDKKCHTYIDELPTTKNKGARCQSIRGRMQQGKVRYPAFAPWWPAAKDQLLKFTGSGDDKEDDFCDMMGMIGQILEEQRRPSGKKYETNGNVIKVGTIAWVKEQHNIEKKAKERLKARGGF